MSVHTVTRQEEPISHDHEHWPEGHYRGRGNRQDGTGPNSPFLEGAPAEHMVGPAPGEPAEATRNEAAEAHLVERVREALRDHGDIDASRIDVVVDGDFVTLRGMVRNHWAHHYAANLVSAVDGVGGLQNDLEIERNAAGEEQGGPTTDARGPEIPKGHFP